MKTFLLIGLLSLTIHQAQADISRGKPIKVEFGIPGWNSDFTTRVKSKKNTNTYPAAGMTECREVQEIPGAHLCLSYTQEDMNMALGRASFFVEGTAGAKKEVVVAQNDYTFRSYLNEIGGHDLKRQDLLRFYEAAQKACVKEKNCFNKQESELFENFILPEIKKNPNFVIITYAIESTMDYEGIVTHEILHAQYFLNPEFQKVTNQYWDTRVSESDKRAIRRLLSKNYDSSDELLMKNEFQAYILQFDAENFWMKDYLSKYRAGLLSALAAKGLKPVLVQ